MDPRWCLAGMVHFVCTISILLQLILQTTASSLVAHETNLEEQLSDLRSRRSDVPVPYKSRLCTYHASDAQIWMESTDHELGIKLQEITLLSWDYFANMTDDTLAKLEESQKKFDEWMFIQLLIARNFMKEEEQMRRCNETTHRLLKLFTNYNYVPVAIDPDTRVQITRLALNMSELTATTEVVRDGKVYRLDPELEDIMATSRDYDELLWAWEAWHNSSRPIKPLYVEFVNKSNEAAKENGFANLADVWQMVDFLELDVEPMMDDLLKELMPLYKQLHSFVRRKLILAYPNRQIDPHGPIPAHLLGEMFGQQWENIIDLVTPYPHAPPINVTKALREQNFTALEMFKLAEGFFTSIGLEPMTSDFWEKSIIVRPASNVSMDCHGSAWDFVADKDFRIMMCTVVNEDDLWTVHHEMGHIEYFMQYRHQGMLFRTGANAAFHEAIGDTITLSAMTTKHLKTIGLYQNNTGSNNNSTAYEQKINFLMKTALTKVAFIPFGYIVDKWRFQVFKGEITPNEYNTRWWKLREQYQGIAPSVPRPATEFDPGAKYHIPANVPYSRYFFSFFGQFQFQSALCRAAHHNGSMSDCDIYKSTDAGSLLKSVLELGASKPWPDVMEKFTGQRKFKADALLDYFAPLREWLENENKGQHVGWTTNHV